MAPLFSLPVLCDFSLNIVSLLTLTCQLLNHPHLSAHIDETDEDALSYMTDLEVGIVVVFSRCFDPAGDRWH